MSVGMDLKAARESKKISLDKVSERTKIPAKYLEAIEEGRFDIFPSHTYAKGFIRAYGKVVGLDPAVLTRQFNAEVAPVEVSIQPKNAEAELEKNLGWRPALDRPPVFRKSDEEPDLNLEMVEEESTQHDPTVMRQRNFALRRGKWSQWAGKVIVALLVLALAGTALTYGIKLVSKIKWSSPKPETTALDNPAYQPVVVADKYQHLILKGLDKSWVQVTMDDGQSTSEVDLDQGETKTYKALKSFKVKLGNAGGVQIQFNGKPLGILGTTGQVVEIQLPPGSSGSDETSDSSDSGT
jgi:transcriptional regulator with XRE-family HTH domain